MSGRIRTIKPEWMEDELLAALPDSDRTLSVGLILMADDHGRGRAADAFVAGEVWRYDRSPEVLTKAREGLLRLSGIRFIRLYIRDGQRYFEIRNWKIHQKVQHVGKPRVPPPLEPHETLTNPHETFTSPPETLTPDLRPHITDLDLDHAPAEPAPTKEPAAPRKRPATRQPDIGVPEWLAALKVPSLNDPRWGSQVAAWLDHHRAKDSRFADWAAAWRTWERNAKEWGRAPPPPTPADPRPKSSDPRIITDEDGVPTWDWDAHGPPPEGLPPGTRHRNHPSTKPRSA